MKTKLLRGELFKRVLSVALTLVMLLSLVPMVPHAHAAEEGKEVYLKPNSNWLIDNARFAAYYWNDGGSDWTDMTDSDGDGYYKTVIPAGYSNVIFCRMNPNATDNNWTNKWNQTSDLTVPTDGTNCYTVAEGTWDAGGGTWSEHNVSVSYSVSCKLTNVKSSNSETSVEEKKEYTTTLTAEKGYALPASVSVSVAGAAISSHSYDSTTGELTIPAEAVTGDIVITASGVALTYLKPNANWLVDGARFAIYYFNDSGNGWTGMSDSDGDGYYEGTVPAGYSNIIFCRMNPNTTENNWNNKWNQTSDLTVPTDGTNCYTVAEGAWDNGSGTWSVYPPEEGGDEDDKDPGVQTEDYYLIGYINGADHGCEADWANLGDYKFVNGKLTATFTQDSYVFIKTGDNAGWYMAESYSIADSVTLKNTTAGTSEKLFVPGNKELTFTLVENEDGSLTLSYAEVAAEPAVDYYLIGYINGADHGCEADWANLGDYKFVNGKLTATFTQDSYVFIKTGDNANWYMAEAYSTDKSVTLKNTTAGTSEKLFVPGNEELTFTLVENEDGSLTLSYSTPQTEIPEGYTVVTIHFLKPEGWGSNINAYLWTGAGAVPGYESFNTWPGKGIGTNATHTGWYDLVVATETPMAFNFIFNDNANQTADLTTGEVTGNTELWVVGNDVMTTAPGEWSGDYDYTANIHFQKPETWGEIINAWIWDANGAIPGYEQYQTNWPGAPIDADSINTGWYNVSVTMDEDAGFSFILNDGSNQTSDLSTGTLKVKTDLWVVDGKIQTEAPAGWVDPNRKVYVPGTFPGPSWDAGSNQMSYDPELGLYVYTFKDVPAANYEFKIAINGSWNENYGVGGVSMGDNIPVAVPETMDVTVYYNDSTHNAVTSVTYVFADIMLSGTGIPEGTKLTDEGLSGIYSATVSLKAGTYDDIVLSFGGEAYSFVSFELTEDKDVTFYFDPATGIYYHNGSDKKVEDAVYYNSKDEAYKSPYGAVAAGEEVTFTIDTGDDAVQVKLVVKGVGTFDMEQPEVAAYELGTKSWTCTVTINTIGEYDYYFVISNGADMKVYCDDDGYYGEGKLADLTNVMPYDLVVYKSGFETPDWMKDAVIYQIFPDRFFDGDPSNNLAQTWARGEVDYEYVSNWYTLPENPEQEALLSEGVYKATGAWWGDGEWSNEIYGGDLEGITQRIGYLKALGVNVIYLNPVFWSISNHRYDAVDYTEIDPILGTLGDFNELVSAATANGMHIILDGVFNHVSDDSIYFDRYYKFLGKSEKIGAYPYWAYVYDYMAENKADQAAAEAAAKAYFGENYGITDYSYTEWFKVSATTMAGTVDNVGLRAGKEVYSYEGWWGYDSMPVIYSTNGSEYQTGNWAEEIIYNNQGSSVTQYWLSKGSDGWRLDVANEVSDETWINFRASVKALNSDAVIIGEIWTDATKYLMGDMYDSVMNYVFRSAVTDFAMGTKNAQQAANELERIRERYPEEAFYAMMNLVGSHDTSRILSYLDGIGDDRADKSLAAAFPTYESTSSTAKKRQYLVSFLQFTYPGAPTIYYGDEIGMVGADDPDDRRAFAWGQGNKELVEWYATLAAIREEYAALRTGDLKVIETGSSNLMGYTRENLIVVANNASSAVTFVPEEAYGISYTDIITGTVYAADAAEYTVPGYSGVILVPTDEVKTVTVNYSDLAPAYEASYVVGQRDVSHTHSYTATEVKATCEEAGYILYACECGADSYTVETDPALGHDWDAGKVTKTPTCSKEGVKTYTCTREDCGETKTESIDKVDHTWGAWKVTKEATCGKDGTKERVCSACGAKETETIKATGKHVDKDEDEYCDVCGEGIAETGDRMTFVWVAVMVIAGVALIALLVVKKHRKK